MEWLKGVRGKTVGLDTAPLIYLIEKNEKYLDVVRAFFQSMDNGELTVVTSVLTLSEVLVQPLKHGDSRLAQAYRNILLGSNILTVGVTPEIAEEAARLRAALNIRTPDALQIATALHEGAEYFLTNDRKLVQVPDLKVILLSSD
ncbi:MAG: type II toxin-antitoxin system VapC family toxin [Myxococcota bacterium]|jgi:predicted nucleic acid-binding protein